MTILIGMTGKIACGKSTVINLLREMGAETIDADKVAHQLMEPNTPVWRSVIREFGDEIVKPNGEIDRGILGAKVFSDPKAMARLEEITHPMVVNKVKAMIAQSCAEVIVLEAIKIYESGLYRLCNSIWFVACSRDQQLQRLMVDRGLTREEAEARIAAQESLNDNAKRADVVIDNSGSLDTTISQIVAAWESATGRPARPRKA